MGWLALEIPASRLKQPAFAKSRQLFLFLRTPTAAGLQYPSVLQEAANEQPRQKVRSPSPRSSRIRISNFIPPRKPKKKPGSAP